MSNQKTLPNSRNAISSPASVGGPTPSDSPAGPMIDRPGQQASRVSRFRALDNKREMPTNDTSGPLFTTLSPSAGLQASLANRLRARMAANGSPEYALIWKDWDMPAGPPICRLRASAWELPKHRLANGWSGPYAIVPIPISPGACAILPIGLAVQLSSALHISGSACSGWPTPTASLANKGVRTQEGALKEAQRAGTGADLAAVSALAGWPTPSVAQATGGQTSRSGDRKNEALMGGIARGLAGWVTPAARDWKDTPGMATAGTNPDGTIRNRVDQLLRQAHTVSISNAQTGKPAALNPAHSRWLMGFPPEWDDCVPMATPSGRKSRVNS